MILLLVFLTPSFHSQLVTKADTLNRNILEIQTDNEVMKILNQLDDACHKNSASTIVRSTSTPAPRKNVTYVPIATNATVVKVKSEAEICRENPKILGYKIQLNVVKSREEANEIAMFFRRRFPSIKTELDASLRPNYKVLAGSYRSRQSAQSDYSRIRSLFPNAIPIQYRVFCVEAK